MNNKNEFPMKEKSLIYFDNAATTFKPYRIIDKMNEYYYDYNANSHRGDYDISFKVDDEIDYTRDLVKMFINAKKTDEIIFTKNTTDSLNMICFGYFLNYLKENDEIILSSSEHASNILPWLILSIKKNIKIVFVDSVNEKLNINDLVNKITKKTKVISLAHITNVSGDRRDIKTICKIAHKNNILVVVDGAQSVPHIKTDVQDLDVDFLAFSAHKMCGPTGVGILYGKLKHLKKMKPILFGGGMNASFASDQTRVYDDVPRCFEAGTPNVEGILAFGKIIEYLNAIGMNNIHNYVKDLRKYAIKRFKEIDDIVLYNENFDSNLITFNKVGVFAQDLSIYLSRKNICIRAGNHCAKMLKECLGVKNTCRVSLYFYNTRKDIDKLIDALKNKNIKNEII